MNPYIGDRELDPPEDLEDFVCPYCEEEMIGVDAAMAHMAHCCADHPADHGEPNEPWVED